MKKYYEISWTGITHDSEVLKQMEKLKNYCFSQMTEEQINKINVNSYFRANNIGKCLFVVDVNKEDSIYAELFGTYCLQAMKSEYSNLISNCIAE